MNDPDVKLLAVILIVVAVVAAGWYFRDEIRPQSPEPVSVPVVPPATDAVEPVGPKYPVSPPAAGESAGRNLVPLPALDDSDAYFLIELVDIFGSEIEPLLVNDGLIDRIVTSVDNLPRGHVAEKVRPVGRLPDFFKVEAKSGDGPIYLSPENFRRYDALVGRIAAADIDAIVDTYRRFHPLFNEAYLRLGYPQGYFNDRVIEVIDHLLATPQPGQPVRLIRPNVLYEFAAPELEALSAGQKLLLRMGPDNAAAIRQLLKELRAELVR